MNITLSHTSVVSPVAAIGKDFDGLVIEWKDSFIPILNEDEVMNFEYLYDMK